MCTNTLAYFFIVYKLDRDTRLKFIKMLKVKKEALFKGPTLHQPKISVSLQQLLSVNVIRNPSGV